MVCPVVASAADATMAPWGADHGHLGVRSLQGGHRPVELPHRGADAGRPPLRAQAATRRPDGTRGIGLFAYLRSLQGDNGGDRRDVIATVFKGMQNRMINGYLLRDVVDKINGIHFNSSEEMDTLSRLYETILAHVNGLYRVPCKSIESNISWSI